MQKLSILLFALIFLFACKSSTSESQAESESVDLQAELPLHPDVRTGTLDNGMQYFLLYNQKPENRAEFRLALKAGSMQELDNQQGLAHFVEHMCFNGTKNFERSELVDYLESIGVSFGAHLNAYTSFDETVYMLKLPTDSVEILDKGMQVLEDWAHQVTFEPEMIEDERGVVIEEWRSSLGPDMRMLYQYLPVVLEGSRYAERLPIGKTDILETFPHEALTSFYADWYRPELMGLIVVGDFDIDDMEQRIINQFGGLENPADAPAREEYGIPDHEGTKVAVITDPEASYTEIEVLFKHPKSELKTVGDYRKDLMSSLYAQMFSMRYEEIKQQDDPPFASASSYYGEFLGDKDAYSMSATVSEDKVREGLMTLLVENERVRRHGWTEGELERAKKEMLSGMERSYNERDKKNSGNLTWGLVSHFLEGKAWPGISFKYDMAQKIIPGITLEEMNELAGQWITETNNAVIITGPENEKADYPSEEEILAMMSGIKEQDIVPYEDNFIGDDLMAETPSGGSVTNTETIDELGITMLTFANGAKAILKPTDFKNDEILFNAWSYGGTSLYEDADYWSASMAAEIMAQSGVGEYSMTDLQKLTAGKQFSVTPFIDDVTEGFLGSSTPADLEMALQMIYLYFNAPRKDETAFNALKTQMNIMLGNLASNPDIYFYLEAAKLIADGNIRGMLIPEKEDLDKIELDKSYDIFQERFTNGGDFTFMFVGNFEVDEISPMLETYIGGLPSGETETFIDREVNTPKGKVNKTLNKGTEPKSQVMMVYHGEMEYNFAERHLMYSTIDVLDIMLRESMREEMGGVYGVSVYPDVYKYPKSEFSVTIMWSCDPENVDALIATAEEQIALLKSEGPSLENIQKIQEQQRRQRETDLEENSWWNSALGQYFRHGEDPMVILDYDSYVDGLSVESIQGAAHKFLGTGNRVKVVMYPEEAS